MGHAATTESYKLYSNDEFKSLVKSNHAPADAKLRKSYTADVIKAPGSDPSRRIYRWTISTITRDRDKDTLDPNGWQLDNFKSGGVIPFAHDYHALPVAKPLSVFVQDGKLVSDADFTDTAEIYPFADMVARMVEKNILRCASVGFAPIKYVYNEPANGMDFSEQELLEWSVVPVPSNPDALLQAKSLGIDVAPFKAWAEEMLDHYHGDNAGAYYTQADLEQVIKMLKSKKIITVKGTKKDELGGDLPAPVGGTDIQPANPAVAAGTGVAVCPRGASCPKDADEAIESCSAAECPLRGESAHPPIQAPSGDHGAASANLVSIKAALVTASAALQAAISAFDIKGSTSTGETDPGPGKPMRDADGSTDGDMSTDDMDMNGKDSTDGEMCGTTGLNPLSTAAENMDHARSLETPVYVIQFERSPDEIVVELVESVSKTYDIDKGELQQMIRHTIAESITEIAKDSATREINRQRGRIND